MISSTALPLRRRTQNVARWAISADVSSAKSLRANSQPKACFQGQNPGHEGFLLTPEWAFALFEENHKYREVVLPFLTVGDLLSTFPATPKHYVIDFHPRQMRTAAKYATPFEIVRKLVLPDRERAAAQEKERNSQLLWCDPAARVDDHHLRFLKYWWILSWDGGEMIQRVNRLPRYIVCGYVGQRPVFEFASRQIRPSAGCTVFPFADDYCFGVLQSEICRTWFAARHPSNQVFETFPWPQSPGLADVRRVAKAARSLRALRRMCLDDGSLSLRELYERVDLAGENPLRAAEEELDEALRAAYKMESKPDTLRALLELNLEIASLEAAGIEAQGPGVPAIVRDKELADFGCLDGMEIQPLER